MCFSAEMDLAMGTVITGVGVDALRQARTREQVVVAALPVTFGIHQLVETLVWLDLEGSVSHDLGSVAK